MTRVLALLSLMISLMIWSAAALAQEFSARARVLPDASRVTDSRGGMVLRLGLSQGVPWRAYTLTDPARLVLDFREVEWTGLNSDDFDRAEAAQGVRFGGFRPGWSRMVVDLAAPLAIKSAEMQVAQDTGQAALSLALTEVKEDDFAAQSGTPHDPRWDLPDPQLRAGLAPPSVGAGPLVVVIDPGHGGIDPGAKVGGVTEKDLMLTFARELRDALRRAGGIEVVMTRNDDIFVSLDRRIAIAHEARAHVFLSLHADALAEGLAHGVTVYVLDAEASDAATRQLAERHDRDDILSGVDLSGQDDVVAGILMDLARQETRPRTDMLARALVAGLVQAGGPVNKRPIRHAAFSVLKAADIPSALIEVGFLSSPRDLQNLTDPAWRAGIAQGITEAVQAWAIDDQARAALRRQ